MAASEYLRLVDVGLSFPRQRHRSLPAARLVDSATPVWPFTSQEIRELFLQ
jgi:hypothetical protein